MQRVARLLLSTGVTSFCPTIVSSSPSTYAAVTRVFSSLSRRRAAYHDEALGASTRVASIANAPGARILGLHLEGPFINLERKGAHSTEHIRAPGAEDGPAALADVYGPHIEWDSGDVRIVTLAPELPGALACIRALAERGVVASIGHTSAGIRTADGAVSYGARMVTHLFNAMAAFHHRDPGVVGLLGRMRGGVTARVERQHQHNASADVRSVAPIEGSVESSTKPISVADAGAGGALQGMLLGGSSSAASETSHSRQVISAVTRRGAMGRLHASGARESMPPQAGHAFPSSILRHAQLQEHPHQSSAPMLLPALQSAAASASTTLLSSRSVELAPDSDYSNPVPGMLRGAGSFSLSSLAQIMMPVTPTPGNLATVESRRASGISGSAAPSVRALGRITAYSPVPFEAPKVRTAQSSLNRQSLVKDTAVVEVVSDGVFAAAPLPSGSSARVPIPETLLDLPGSDAHGRPFYGLIADGVHVHPYAIAVAHATNPSGLVLVTDAMQAMGLPVGRHQLGGLDVDIFEGLADGHYEGLHAVLTGTNTLAGAVVPLDTCLRNLLTFTECSLAEALCTVTLHPARALRLQHVIGSLHCGAWADMVLLKAPEHHHGPAPSTSPEVLLTFVAGELVWKR